MNAKRLKAISRIAVIAIAMTYREQLVAQDFDGGTNNAGRTVKTHQASIRLTPVVKSELTSPARWLAFSSDGTRVATGGHSDVAIYDTAKPNRIRTIRVPDGVGSVVFSHDSQTVYATAGNSNELRWWRVAPVAGEGVWKPNVVGVCCAFSSGDVLAIGHDKIMLVNPHTGKQKTVIETNPETSLYDPYLDTDGTFTVMENRGVGDQPYWIRRIDFAKGIIRERQFNVGREEAPDPYRCGDRFVVVLNWKEVPGQDPICELEVWGGAEFKKNQTVKIPDSEYIRTGVFVGGDLFCVGGQPPDDNPFNPTGFFAFVDIKTGKVLGREKFLHPVRRLAFSNEKKLLAALIWDGELRIWKLEID